jgi:hypothetical protein
LKQNRKHFFLIKIKKHLKKRFHKDKSKLNTENGLQFFKLQSIYIFLLFCREYILKKLEKTFAIAS